MTTRRWLTAFGGRARIPDQYLRQGGPQRGCVLADLDPIATPPQADLIAAAIRLTKRHGVDAETRLLWGRYAYCGTRRLHGADHPMSLAAATAYQTVLADQQLSFDVVRICEDRVASYQRLGLTDMISTGLRELALALHNDGQCEHAEHQIGVALRRWRTNPVDHSTGETLVLCHTAILAGCGRTTQAVRVLQINTGLLAPLRWDGQVLAAHWLAYVETTHPAACGRHPPIARGRDTARHAFWLGILHGDP